MLKKAAEFVPPFVRTPYNYDRDAASDESGLRCEDPSLAKQEFAEEADINTIVRRFNLTGQLPQNVVAPTYADFEEVFDFHSAMTAVAKAQEAFMRFPAHIRSEFNNDAELFVAFCSDPANRERAIKLGLVGLPPAPEAPPSGDPGAPGGEVPPVPTGGSTPPAA